MKIRAHESLAPHPTLLRRERGRVRGAACLCVHHPILLPPSRAQGLVNQHVKKRRPVIDLRAAGHAPNAGCERIEHDISRR